MAEMPDELIDLAEMLDSGSISLLKKRVYKRQVLRTALSRFSDRVWFFPFGIQPDLDKPVTVFRNGQIQAEEHDFIVGEVGNNLTLAVVIFHTGLTQDCTAQATYFNIPPDD